MEHWEKEETRLKQNQSLHSKTSTLGIKEKKDVVGGPLIQETGVVINCGPFCWACLIIGLVELTC